MKNKFFLKLLGLISDFYPKISSKDNIVPIC